MTALANVCLPLGSKASPAHAGQEAGLTFDPDRRSLSEELHRIVSEIEAGDVATALSFVPLLDSWILADSSGGARRTRLI